MGTIKSDEHLLLLTKIYLEIFPKEEKLSLFEKRKRIFNYLVQNLSINYNYYELLISGQCLFIRNGSKELKELIKTKKGLGNAISQLYKLLLEKAGIYSLCYICNDRCLIFHELNLVKMGDTYSFDDISSVIAKKGNAEDYFNYDLNGAYERGQGISDLPDLNMAFVGIPSMVIYDFIGLDSQGIDYDKVKDPNFEENIYGGLELPEKIEVFNEVPDAPEKDVFGLTKKNKDQQ
jgi:hypothetical protein